MTRVWDQIHPSELCYQHLAGEWKEIWGVWKFVTTGAGVKHPECLRWVPYKHALWVRMKHLREEREQRLTPTGKRMYSKQLPPEPRRRAELERPEPFDNQVKRLHEKGCECKVLYTTEN